MASYRATRAGTILAVTDVQASVTFYTDLLGLELIERYEDPPYATLRVAGARLSLAEQGHDAPDRPNVDLVAPEDPTRANALLVVEVDDATAAFEELTAAGVRTLAPAYRPPWGGCRFFCVDPDGYLIEIEEPS